MSILKAINTLRYMDRLIRTKSTGNQKEFSRKLGVHRSTLNEYIKEMKCLGFPIKFCNNRKSYYYEEHGQLTSSFFEREMTKDEMKKIHGGIRSDIFLESDYIGLPISTFILQKRLLVFNL